LVAGLTPFTPSPLSSDGVDARDAEVGAGASGGAAAASAAQSRFGGRAVVRRRGVFLAAVELVLVDVRVVSVVLLAVLVADAAGPFLVEAASLLAVRFGKNRTTTYATPANSSTLQRAATCFATSRNASA
jgi:hypothetical protein